MNYVKKYKYAFLINPLAGSGYVKEILTQLPTCLSQINLSQDHYHLEQTRIDQVQKQAQDLSRLATTIIVIGGDGTVSDTIAGIFYGDPATTLGIVPLGTANDLARTLNIYQLFNSKPFNTALEQLLNAPSIPLDVWQINGHRIMSNYLSLGLDAAVATHFGRKRRANDTPRMSLRRSKVEFFIHGLRQFSHRIRLRSYLCFWHNGRKQKIPLDSLCSIIFSNIKHYASGMGPVPLADYNDGLLDITLLPTLPHLFGLFITQYFKPIHRFYSRNLIKYCSNHIEIYSPPGNYLQIDGEDHTELLLQGKLTIENIGQIKVLAYA